MTLSLLPRSFFVTKSIKLHYCFNPKIKQLNIRHEDSLVVEDALLVDKFDSRLALSVPV